MFRYSCVTESGDVASGSGPAFWYELPTMWGVSVAIEDVFEESVDIARCDMDESVLDPPILVAAACLAMI